jgi:hypothetical protein
MFCLPDSVLEDDSMDPRSRLVVRIRLKEYDITGCTHFHNVEV